MFSVLLEAVVDAIGLRRWHKLVRAPAPNNALMIISLSDKIGSVKSQLSSPCRREFLRKCWDLQVTDEEWRKTEKKFDSYFSRYEECCQVDRPHALTTCSHEELCHSFRQLITGTRATVEQDMSMTLSAPLAIPRDDRSVVEFMGKSVLRIDLKSWKSDETLSQFIGRTLGIVSTHTDRDRLPPSFNAATFAKKAGIRILWQPDLTSHLDIAFGDTAMKLFHNIALLDLLELSLFKGVFPHNFVQETRRTIDLMLPKSEPRCRAWLKQEIEDTKLGISVDRNAFNGVVDRNLQTFTYWRSHLIVAKDVFDASQPRGLWHLIRDDRNKVQYWTFWIAFVVFWLTLGGFLASCLQTYKAYHPSPQPPWPGSER